jgi:hypothetical protein
MLYVRGFFALPMFGIQFKGTGIVLTYLQLIRRGHIYTVAGHNNDTHMERQTGCTIY